MGLASALANRGGSCKVCAHQFYPVQLLVSELDGLINPLKSRLNPPALLLLLLSVGLGFIICPTNACCWDGCNGGGGGGFYNAKCPGEHAGRQVAPATFFPQGSRHRGSSQGGAGVFPSATCPYEGMKGGRTVLRTSPGGSPHLHPSTSPSPPSLFHCLIDHARR